MSKQKFPWHVAYTYGIGAQILSGNATLTKPDKSLLDKDDLDGLVEYTRKTRGAESVVITFFARMQTITESDELSHE